MDVLIKRTRGGFPGGPVAKTPCSQCRRPRFNSGLGTRSDTPQQRSWMLQLRPATAKLINLCFKKEEKVKWTHTWWGRREGNAFWWQTEGLEWYSYKARNAKDSAAAAAAAKSLQSCPTLCDPIDSSPPGASVPGILQARILEWAAVSFSKIQSYHQKLRRGKKGFYLESQSELGPVDTLVLGFSPPELWENKFGWLSPWFVILGYSSPIKMIHLSRDILIQLLTITSKAATHVRVQVLGGHEVSTRLDKQLGAWIRDHVLGLFSCKETAKLSSKVALPFCISTINEREFLMTHIHASIGYYQVCFYFVLFAFNFIHS